MTREEAVARIKDHIEIHKYHEQNAIKIFEALDMAIKALEKPEQQWIPVTERLPEEKINPNTQDYDWVLCSTTFGDVRAYHFGRGRFLHGCGDVTQYVTAWMPLPEAWRGE